MNQTELHNLILRAGTLVKTNWLHAVHILQQAREEHPENLQVLMSLGEIFLERQHFDKALGYFIEALELVPGDSQLLYLIGNCYFATGEYRLAITYFNQVENPSPEVLYNKALGLAFLGSYKESITVIQQILKVLDDNPFIYFLLIEQYLRIQSYDEAYEVITYAEKRFGKHRQLMILSAIVYSKKGIWLKAYHCFAAYEEIGAINSPEHLINYAVAASRIGLQDKAIELLNRAKDMNPYISTIYEDLIRLYLQRGDKVGAMASLRLAKKYITRFNPILLLLQERLLHGDED